MAIASLIVSLIAIVISAISVWYARKQYLSTLRPELWTNWYHVGSIKKQVSFCIENRSSNTAIITGVKPLKKNITLYQPFHRFELTNDRNDKYVIVCDYRGKDIDSDTYKLRIKYQDKEGNKYSATLYYGHGDLYLQ